MNLASNKSLREMIQIRIFKHIIILVDTQVYHYIKAYNCLVLRVFFMIFSAFVYCIRILTPAVIRKMLIRIARFLDKN